MAMAGHACQGVLNATYGQPLGGVGAATAFEICTLCSAQCAENETETETETETPNDKGQTKTTSTGGNNCSKLQTPLRHCWQQPHTTAHNHPHPPAATSIKLARPSLATCYPMEAISAFQLIVSSLGEQFNRSHTLRPMRIDSKVSPATAPASQRHCCCLILHFLPLWLSSCLWGVVSK